ncbi:hypothetical protein [Metasolibacillus sp. FSL K6-0083]|uniref:hypothetical protein n=1 Tax=Metasolibacillus sp. FSL K6-0083 TaxID=2921416 RepID=UPI003159CAD6
MKKLTKGSILGTALVTILSTVTPTLNAEASSNSLELLKQDVLQKDSNLFGHQDLTLSKNEMIKFSEYVALDNNFYFLNGRASVELTSVEYDKLELIISHANNVIQEFSSTTEFELEILSPQESLNQLTGNQSLIAQAVYIEGVTKVDFHWWGVKIYLSRTDANKAAMFGLGVAGIWIPSKVLTTVALGLGIAGSQPIPGGIWIEQYWVASWGPIKELFGFDAYGYQ